MHHDIIDGASRGKPPQLRLRGPRRYRVWANPIVRRSADRAGSGRALRRQPIARPGEAGGRGKRSPAGSARDDCLPSNAIVRRRLPGRLLLGDRNRPPQHRSAPSRTIPLSPLRSCVARGPASRSDRRGGRRRAIAFRTKRSRPWSACRDRLPSKAIVPRPYAALLRSRESTCERSRPRGARVTSAFAATASAAGRKPSSRKFLRV
jgi:hypothetical protein